jgi:hypothetical protein
MTGGVRSNPGAQLTMPSSLTIRTTRSREPSSARRTARICSPVSRAAARAAPRSMSRPTFPVTKAPSGPTAAVPDRYSRFPTRTAGTYSPTGGCGSGSVMPSSARRASAVIGTSQMASSCSRTGNGASVANAPVTGAASA